MSASDIPVFSSATTDPENTDPNVKNFQLEFPLGGATFKISGLINRASLDTDLKLECKLPILPSIVLADGVKGNLKDGVDCSFDANVVKGNAKFYAKDGYMWMNLDGTVLGQEQKKDIKLLPLQ